MTLNEWGEKYESLNREHKDFVKRVAINGACKYGATPFFSQIDETIALWKMPEELGLIQCMGSYKWRCTITDNLS